MQILTRQDLIAGRAHCCKDCKGAEKLRTACLQKQNLYNTRISGNRIKSRTWCLLYWLSRPTQVSEIKVTRIDEVSRPAKASPLLRQGETVPLQLHDGDSLQLSMPSLSFQNALQLSSLHLSPGAVTEKTGMRHITGWSSRVRARPAFLPWALSR